MLPQLIAVVIKDVSGLVLDRISNASASASDTVIELNFCYCSNCVLTKQTDGRAEIR